MFKILTILFISFSVASAGYHSPAAPTDLILTPAKDSVTLSWKDNSDGESGFKLFRNGEFLTKVSANIETYTDSNLKPNTKYTYLIFAYDGARPRDSVYVKTQNNTILANQKFDVIYRDMSEDDKNWVGIYPRGAENIWDNVLSWDWANGKNGKVELDGLEAGEYELRAYFKNTFEIEDSYTFSVKDALTKKKLILTNGGHWFSIMAENLATNHKKIKKMPFSGYSVVGNSYTNRVMVNQEIWRTSHDYSLTMTYDKVWDEMKGLKDLYSDRDMFLTVWIDFPGDLWDDEVWNTIKGNFEIVAKVAKDLNFKGILFDNETYTKEDLYGDDKYKYNSKKMINFKFPTSDEVKNNEQDYTWWEIKGSESAWVDMYGYRNMAHTFLEHTDKVTERFAEIMEAMVSVYPDIAVLVYHTPALSHENYNKDTVNTIDQSLPRSEELFGPIFTGLKRGLSKNAKLHDMGEMYKYRVDYHFENAYQFRKYGITDAYFNDDLDENYQWIIPTEDRSTWSKKAGMGFVVFNKDETQGGGSGYDGFDTKNTTHIGDIEVALKQAIKVSDEYVIYYCHDQDWLLDEGKVVTPEWLDMMRGVYDSMIK